MYRPVLVTGPASLPLTRDQVKQQLDVPYSDKDELIDGLIMAATSYLDGWTGILGRCLVSQTWRQDFDQLSRCMRIPLAPVISITSLKYDDANDAEQTIGSSNYTVLNDDLGPYVEFISTYSSPTLHVERPGVRVTYVAGYADVPQAIKQAMLLLIRHWFDNPTAVIVGTSAQALPFAVDALLGPWRRSRF